MKRNVPPVELIILEMAKAISDLASNKTDLNAAIKNAYGLAEEESKKAEEARELIAKAALIQADFDKQKEEIGDIESMRAAANVIIANSEKISEDAKQLLDKAEKEKLKLAEQQEQIDKDKAALAKWESALNQRELATREGEKKLSEDKSSWKAKLEETKKRLAG